MAARNYVSTALPTVLAADLGASGNPSVISLPGTWPTSYPFPALIDWGTSAQEAILVTSAPTGSGPYALPCTRGIDNTTQQAHNAGAQVEHGTTGYEPTLIQENAAAIAALEAGVGGGAVALAGDLGNTTADPQVLSTHLSAPLPENQGGTGSASQNWQGLLSPVTQTGTYTATAGQLVKANISSASWTLTLPTAPAANTIIGAKIMANATGNTHALTVACGSGDFFEQSGGGTSVTMSIPLQAAAWQYNGGYWTRVSDDLPLGQLDARYSHVYSPLAFGAAGNGTANDTSAVQAAFAAAISVSGIVDLGTSTFLTSSPITLQSSVTVRAAGGPGGTSGAIVNTASDIFAVSGTVDCFAFQNVTLTASGGHVFNCASGAIVAFGTFAGCTFTQGNAAKSIWYMPSGTYLNMLVGGETGLICNSSATAVPWYVVGQANSNTWSSVRATAGTGITVPFFQVECDSGSAWSSGNTFRDITAEICVAGIIKGLTVSSLTCENVLGYDVSGSYSGSLIYVGAGSGSLRSQGITVRNCGRVGGSLGGSAYDFFAASTTQAILLENVGSESGPGVYSVPQYYTTVIGGDGSYGFTESPSLTASGITPSPAQARLVGGSTVTGPPASGAWEAGDIQPDSAGAIWVCTVAGTPGTWVTASAGYTVSIASFGATTGTSDNGSAINSAIGSLPASGGTIVIPPGNFTYSTAINLAGLRSITFLGQANPGGGASMTSQLTWTGTGSGSAINCQNSNAIVFRNVTLFYSSSSFTGILTDWRNVSGSDTSYGLLDNCYLGSTPSTINSAQSLVNLDKCINMTVRKCNIAGATYGIYGKSVNTNYSNAVQIENCVFQQQATAHIWNAGQAWLVKGCTFEQLTGGTAGAYGHDSGNYADTLTFLGCWSGDSAGGTVYTVAGATVNFIGCWIGATSGTGIYTDDIVTGLNVTGNNFVACTTALETVQPAGSAYATGWVILGNTYTSVTTNLSGSILTGALYHDGNQTLVAYGMTVRDGNFTVGDGNNFIFGSGTGMKLGTATSQKLGFWNATPVVQQVLATGAGHTVDDVISLLQTLGLCAQ